jgi:hypothetical protein
MEPLVAPALEEAFHRRDLCILATRVAIETAKYFGIDAHALPVKTMLYNKPFAEHVANGFTDVADRTRPSTWGDGSWSVGIGYGKPPQDKRWDGHLIAVADSCFGDFSIQQAERLKHNIVTGPGLVGPYAGQEMWTAENDIGTVIEYRLLGDGGSYRAAPDWRDESRRRKVVGSLIRTLREKAG